MAETIARWSRADVPQMAQLDRLRKAVEALTRHDLEIERARGLRVSRSGISLEGEGASYVSKEKALEAVRLIEKLQKKV